MKREEFTPLRDGDILEYDGTIYKNPIPRFRILVEDNAKIILERLDKEQENQTYPNVYCGWMINYKLIRKPTKPVQEIIDECLDI